MILAEQWRVDRPIGVFDSGIGGLSVLLALLKALPHERFVYVADSAHAPYGEKSDAYVRQRTLAIAEHLRQHHNIKAMVLACNTATAATVEPLREAYPQWPLVGIEPAIKPAAQITRTGRVGVMATRVTVSSEKFARLLRSLEPQAHFEVCACNGLAHAIERTTLPAPHDQAAWQEVRQLLHTYTRALGRFGTGEGEIDTLVLGCTHYVFAQEALQEIVGPKVTLVSTEDPVARQTERLLLTQNLLCPPSNARQTPFPLLLSTGEPSGLQAAAQRWLNLPASTPSQQVSIP